MKSILRKIVRYFLLLILLIIGLLYVTGNKHILKGIRCTYFQGVKQPDIDDMKFHSLRTIAANSPTPWKFQRGSNQRSYSEKFLQACETYETEAFLVVHKDQIVAEKYFNDSHPGTYFNSFSMAKSFLAAAIGVAIDEGKIKSLDDKVCNYLPWLCEGEAGELTIRQLLQMASGIDFGESYTSPFGYQAKAYYGDDLTGLTKQYTQVVHPGTMWKYEGGNSVLLGLILKEATGQQVSTYFGNKIWTPIGAEQEAYWKLDHEDGMENTFSAIYATARDFARMGKLYLNKGTSQNRTILSESFIDESIQPVMLPDEDGHTTKRYGLHWWLGEYEGHEVFGCQGMRGQYILVVPDEELVVVRLGHCRSEERINYVPADRDLWLEEGFRIIEEKK